MIPLIRPMLPSLHLTMRHFKESIEQGQISNFGPCYEKLVKRINHGSKMHSVITNSGFSALLVAIQTVFKRGDKILVPDYTHVATLQAVIAAGCVPFLAPVSRKTWTLDLGIKPTDHGIQGAIVVSPFGYEVDFEAYENWSGFFGVPLVYDLAGAWGLKVMARQTLTFSLHATKNVSCGEGGIILFPTRSWAKQGRMAANFQTLPDRQIGSPFGGNYKPDDLTCAIALAHIDQEHAIQNRIQKKIQLIKYYQETFQINFPSQLVGEGSAPSLCVLPGFPAKKIEKECKRKGFQAKQYYPLLTQMKGLVGIPRIGSSDEKYFNSCLALPSDLLDGEADKVIKAMKKLL